MGARPWGALVVVVAGWGYNRAHTNRVPAVRRMAAGRAIICRSRARERAVAFFRVVKGSCPGQILELRGERIVLGRHPNCQIVLDNAAVSRYHAQILESHGNFYVEDLRSRNKTHLNGQPVEGRTLLGDGDTLKICDIVFSFHLTAPPPLPLPSDEELSSSDVRVLPPDEDHRRTAADVLAELPSLEDSGEVREESSIISTLDVRTGSSSLRLHVNPEVKLRAMLEIGSDLTRVLNLDEILQKILVRLFTIFPQADAGFVLLKEPETERLLAQATQSRKRDDSDVRISMTIVNQAMLGREAILSADAIHDPQFQSSDSLPKMQIRSTMCAPVLGGGETSLGVIQIYTEKLRQPFKRDDLDVLVSVASQVSLAVENARLHSQLLRQREIQRDLEVATQIQLGFLPDRRPRAAGYEFSDYYEAAQSVGGDYFDYVALPQGRVAIAIADVAGKGIPAALLMARLYSAARYHLLTHASVAEAMTGLNAEIASSGLGFRFITCVLAVLNPSRHELTLANAGHQPPLRRTAGGTVDALAKTVSGMPLGVTPQQTFQEATLHLEPGDTVVFYTDGITEAMNPDEQIYGIKGLAAYLARGPVEAEDLTRGITTDIEQFSQGHTQRDDRCLVCLRRVE